MLALRPILAFLLLAICLSSLSLAQQSASSDSDSSDVSPSSSSSSSSPSATSAAASATSSSANNGMEYYPTGDGQSYTESNSAEDEAAAGASGDSDGFMSIGAIIGIVVAVVVLAVGLLVGLVLFYLHRRKQWEKEIQRRSMMSIVPPKLQRASDDSDVESRGVPEKSAFESELDKPGFLKTLFTKPK